jgi:hypothetical protein
VQSGLQSNTARLHDWRKFSIIRGSADNFHGRRRSQTSATQDSTSRNAIGINTNLLDRSNGSNVRRRELATATPASTAAKNEPGMSRPDAANQISSPAAHSGAKTDFPTVTAVNHSIINGTGLTRSTSSPAIVGGPAKNLTGAINGSNFRLRHP